MLHQMCVRNVGGMLDVTSPVICSDAPGSQLAPPISWGATGSPMAPIPGLCCFVVTQCLQQLDPHGVEQPSLGALLCETPFANGCLKHLETPSLHRFINK